MKVKVLYFVDRMLRGGIQTFALENMRHMDRDKVQIDYLLLDDGKHYELEDTLNSLGSSIYKLKGIWLNTPIDYIRYKRALDAFFKDHFDYDIVHLHSSSKNWLVLYYAKRYGIPIRIAHAHNIDFQTQSRYKLFFANIFKPLLKKYATDFFACSEAAGKWLFGNKEFMVIKNAVDTKRFQFNQEKREQIRRELGITKNFVVGNVGRFSEQKNHSFLINVFDEIHKRKADAKLLLIGQGEKQVELEKQVRLLRLNDCVIFAGFHNNVEDYMSAMDVFVFPSHFEGLGLVLIEAQANGLPCYTSKDVVPLEAKVSEQLDYLPLDADAEYWAENIVKSNKQRKNVIEQIKDAGYMITDTAAKLECFYINKKRKSKRRIFPYAN